MSLPETTGGASASTLPSLPPWLVIDKSLPRPAPTEAYSWRDYHPNARCLYIRSHTQANKELANLKPGPIGFDLEWKPNYVSGAPENPVALVQLANDEVILLLQISAMREIPSRLIEVLENPLYVKTGVAIQGDAQKIARDCALSLRNCVDLSLLARTVDNNRWQGKYNSSLGLARLIEVYEYRILVKSKITRSNWESVLSPMQVEYASNDAHAGYTLLQKLQPMLSSLNQTAEKDWFTFNFALGQFVTDGGLPWYPINPNYDSGPPPPPRLPREVKVKHLIPTDHSQNSTEGPVIQPQRIKRHSRSFGANREQPSMTLLSHSSPKVQGRFDTRQPSVSFATNAQSFPHGNPLAQQGSSSSSQQTRGPGYGFSHNRRSQFPNSRPPRNSSSNTNTNRVSTSDQATQHGQREVSTGFNRPYRPPRKLSAASVVDRVAKSPSAAP